VTTASGERGARTDRMARTRAALVDAALDLMAERGFDAVTTEDIAQAAGVSPRTFFRYFATKESVLLFGEADFVSSLTGVLLAQPPDLPEIEAVASSFVSLAPGISGLHRRIRLFYRSVQSSHVLRGQEAAQQEASIRKVAEALARRRGLLRPDAGCQLLATVSLTTLQQAMYDWALGSARADLGKAIEERFALLVSLVGGR
jgi:AcrR family transcriptional regulator